MDWYWLWFVAIALVAATAAVVYAGETPDEPEPRFEDTDLAARTATFDELYNAGMIGTGATDETNFFLGHLWDGALTRLEVYLPPDNKANVVCIGPPGSGKTTLLVNGICKMKRRPKMWFDLKGEITAMVRPMLERENPGSTWVVNAWELLADKCPHLADDGMNVALNLTPEDINFSDDADGLCLAMNASHGQGGPNSFFNDGATYAMSPVLQDLRMSGGEGANLGTFRELICQPYGIDKKGDPIGLFKKFIELTESPSPEVRAKAGRFAAGSKSSMEVIASACNETTFLDSPALKKSLRGPKFDWQNFKNSDSALATVIPVDKLNSHKGYLRLIMATGLRELMRSGPSQRVAGVALMIDEFPQLGFMSELLTAAATARGFGVRFMPMVIQDLNQLRGIYGNDKFLTFLSTASCICAFAPRDSFTAETLSKLCGEKIVAATTTSLTDTVGRETPNLSTSHQFQRLFRPDQLMTMPRGRMLCLVEHMLPFFVQVPNYWEEEWGRSLALNPYHTPRQEAS